jgi:homoserine acetyltransferase
VRGVGGLGSRGNEADHLGVRHLVAVAGPSYGGYQAFQWAVAYPDFMDAIVPVNTAPWGRVFPTWRRAGRRSASRPQTGPPNGTPTR